jgi:squalene-associated FAD-dependent desaturase
VIDAAPQAGGRARRVDVALGDRRYALDNGQHLMIGAYTETLRLIARVGLDPQRAFVRVPLTLRYSDGFALRARRLPAPFHLVAALLGARGISARERLALARWVEQMRRGAWRATPDRPAIELFAEHPEALVERIWQPLCVAALNARLQQASAAMLLTVLRDSLGADRRASDLLLPRGDLSGLFPDAAIDRLQITGEVRLREPVSAVQRREPGCWRVVTRRASIETDAVVLALPPERAGELLATVGTEACTAARALLDRIGTAPIATVYVRYPTTMRLPEPFFTLREDPLRGQYGQWVFDRGALDPGCAGIFSVVVSAEGPHLELERSALADAVVRQLERDFALPSPIARAALIERRATVVPAPGLKRPPVRLAEPGLYLAGDAAESRYPSTIEGSVRSGIAAARAVLQDFRSP